MQKLDNCLNDTELPIRDLKPQIQGVDQNVSNAFPRKRLDVHIWSHDNLSYGQQNSYCRSRLATSSGIGLLCTGAMCGSSWYSGGEGAGEASTTITLSGRPSSPSYGGVLVFRNIFSVTGNILGSVGCSSAILLQKSVIDKRGMKG